MILAMAEADIEAILELWWLTRVTGWLRPAHLRPLARAHTEGALDTTNNHFHVLFDTGSML